MEFYSTNHRSPAVSLREAVLSGLPPDGGLYMPETIPRLPDDFLKELPSYTLPEIAFNTISRFTGDAINEGAFQEIITEAISFDAPLVSLRDRIYSLELFHGPTLAFKDFGARFMARLMSHFVRNEDQELTILVATSGDTGSAVAQGFHKVPGITVCVLYPQGKVSQIQEKQFTTLGENIIALEVQGNFDDCQRLVKQAFLDEELRNQRWMTSANSINIARLLPQMVYYFYGVGQLERRNSPVIISVPSGNYGNLTAGLLAKRMGLPVQRFIAAANRNDVVPEYLQTGEFHPRSSVETISNAMDVGDPSNFARMKALYGDDLERMREDVAGYSYSDSRTRRAIGAVYKSSDYVLDPHGAVGYLALRDYLETEEASCRGIFLETAHPAKFADVVEEEIGREIALPERLRVTLDQEKQSVELPADYSAFREYLLGP